MTQLRYVDRALPVYRPVRSAVRHAGRRPAPSEAIVAEPHHAGAVVTGRSLACDAAADRLEVNETLQGADDEFAALTSSRRVGAQLGV
ncbi:hypothetical protein GCM10023238_15010 [Streptomyces heliomycini]